MDAKHAKEISAGVVCLQLLSFHVINNNDSQVQEQSDTPSIFLSTHLQMLSFGLFQLDKSSKILFIGPQVMLV